MGPIRLPMNMKVGGFCEKENQLCLPEQTTTHKYFGFPTGRTRDGITPHFGQIYKLNN